MKNINKISVIIIILFVIGVIFSHDVQAIGNIFSDADNFLYAGDSVGSKIDEDQLIETSNFMYKLLMAIGIIVMFIVGTILGIQFMVASAEDKAKVKEALVPYIVGCVVIFGAFTIWSIAVNIGQGMTSVTTTYKTKYYTPCGHIVDGKEYSSSGGKCPECGVTYGTTVGTLMLSCDTCGNNSNFGATSCSVCGLKFIN